MTTKNIAKTATAISALITLAATTIALCIHKATKQTITEADFDRWENDIDYEDFNPFYYEGLEFMSYGDRTCCVSGIGDCTDTEIIVPSVSPNGEIVTSIGFGAFSGCTGLTSITIPSSVTSIGSDAFSGCTALRSVTMSKGVTSIHSGAFSGCTSLQGVAIPASVKKLGNRAFENCTSLENVLIHDCVTDIGDYVFSGCTNLTAINITNIGDDAFNNWTDDYTDDYYDIIF